MIDSSPVPVCHFARAYRCQRLAEESVFGYDEMSKQTFYGLRVHIGVCWPGVIVGVDLAPADVHDLRLAEEMLEEAKGWVLGNRNYCSADLTDAARGQGAAFAGSPQVQEEGSVALLAALIDPKAAQDRDGDLSVGRALQRQEGIGAGSLAPDLTVAGKVLSRTMVVHTSASKLDSRRYASRSSLLTINPHIGLAVTP